MKLITAYAVRANERPTFEEAAAWVHECVEKLRANNASLPETIEDPGDVRITVSNLTKSVDVEEAILEFVQDCGDDMYLKDDTKYWVMTFSARSGSGHEPTAVALAFCLHGRAVRKNPSADEYVERGRRWEALGRMGDAFHCYFMGLDLAPDYPELLLRLATVEIQLGIVTSAYRHAITAATREPSSSRAAVVLARTYLALIESPDVVVDEDLRGDLPRLALTSAQRAAALDPGNDEARGLLNDLLSSWHEVRDAWGFFEPGVARP